MPVGGEYRDVAGTVIEVTYTDDKFTSIANDPDEDISIDIPRVKGRPVRLLKEAAYEFFKREITQDLGYKATGALRSALDTELTPEQEAIGKTIVLARSNSNEIVVFIIINQLDQLMAEHGDNVGFMYTQVDSTDFLDAIEEMHEDRRLQYTTEPEVVTMQDNRPELE